MTDRKRHLIALALLLLGIGAGLVNLTQGNPLTIGRVALLAANALLFVVITHRFRRSR